MNKYMKTFIVCSLVLSFIFGGAATLLSFANTPAEVISVASNEDPPWFVQN